MVERVVEGLPETDLVSSLDFIEKAVHSCDGLGLVVASKHDDLSRESYLQSVQKANNLARLFPSIDVVSHEKVSSLEWNDSILVEVIFVLILHLLEHVEQIDELAVDITKDFYRCLKLDQWLLFLKYFLTFFNQELNNFNR